MRAESVIPISPKPTDQDKARAFFNHFAAMKAAKGEPLTEAQVKHSKKWIWDSMKRGYKPMLIAPEHVYRHPEATDAE